MKNMHLIAVFGLAVLTLSGCAPKRPVLNIYIWADYLNPEIVMSFEQTYGCSVKVEIFDSNETMYAKVKEGKTHYDIVVPSSYLASLMAQNNMLHPLDKKLLPDVTRNFDVSFRKVTLDPNMTYSVPYAFSFSGLAYRKDKIGDRVVDSWNCLGDPAFAGHVSLLDDPRETIGAALKLLGYSLNTTDPEELQKAKEVVLRWKKNIPWVDNELYKTRIASGELSLAHGYNCDILQVMVHDEENIAFVYPKEGFAVACDEMIIPVGAKEVGLAHAFINFFYVPENACRNIQHICAPMPNRPGLALLSDRYRSSPALLPFAGIIANSEVIKDLGDANALYFAIWNEIMAAE